MKYAAILLVGLWAAPAIAQNGVRSPQGFSIGVAAGGSAFSDFQRSNFQAQRLSASGVEQQEFSRRVGAHTSGSVAGYLAFWPAQNWGLRLYGAYTPSRFEEIISRSAAEFTNAPSADTMAALAVENYQAQALFRLPTIKGRVMPYGIVGGGVMRYTAKNNGVVPAEAATAFSSGRQTKTAASIGAGAMLQMRRRGWGLNFELIDNISRTPMASGPVRNPSSVSFTVGLSLLLQ
ncbi:MAG TPA: hypothetical protein VF021_10875 [Longimicrobiales bacterium]